MNNNTEKKSIGPIKAIGLLLGTVGTAIEAVDNIVGRTANLINTGFDAIEVPANNMLADLRCDSIVDDAKRDARMATAQAEAKAIREALSPKVPRAPKVRTTSK